MSKLNLDIIEKNNIQSFVEKLTDDELHVLLSEYPGFNEASWKRFMKGVYNHPVTWWVGIIQLQMQAGVWGYKWQSIASLRANTLQRVIRPLTVEAKSILDGEPSPLVVSIVKYNFKYRKADIVGRLLGGQFTNYASTGGRFGNSKLPSSVKVTRGVTNFAIAGYGAAIQAVTKGYNDVESIAQSVLIGRPERFHSKHASNLNGVTTKEEQAAAYGLQFMLTEIPRFSSISAQPVAIKEFCERPENINLKGLCRE